jgi:hypothetical protein
VVPSQWLKTADSSHWNLTHRIRQVKPYVPKDEQRLSLFTTLTGCSIR